MKFLRGLSKPNTLKAEDVKPVPKPVQFYQETDKEYIYRLEYMYQGMAQSRNDWAKWGLTLRELMGPPILLSLLACILGLLAWTGVIPPLWR